MRRCQSLFAIRYSLFAILFCALALAEPTVWPVPFEARAMFPAVLDLARASACKDIAALVDREDYAAALALTEKTMAGPFLWRGALTNGYQQGFCLYALHGLLLEQHGEVVRAYRAYQNSRACFDDDTVMMAQPEPRLEVFAGIGRMCVEAGRYTDALMWLETVRIEGNDQPYLCALADRGLIRRAVELGDYHDAITNYWDLQAALAKVGAASAPRSAAPTLNDGLERDTTNQPIRDQASGIRDPASFEDQVSSFNPLSREEHRELGQLYFWTWRDREGFAQVLDGITLLGIDNDLGMRDPLLDCFVNNIMRADDNEIQRFYDLLGYAITQARAMKGDEEYLAHLVRTRQLLCTLFDWLRPDDDMAALRVRTDEVRYVLLQQQHTITAVSTPKRMTPYLQNHMARVQFPDVADSNATAEDALMAADYNVKRYHYRDAARALETAQHCSPNARARRQSYDDTTCEDAIAANHTILAIVRGNATQQLALVRNFGSSTADASQRMRKALMLAKQEEIRHELDSGGDDSIAFGSHSLPNEPWARVYLSLLTAHSARAGHMDKAQRLYGALLARKCSVPGTAAALIGAHIKRGEYERAVVLLVQACVLGEDTQSRQHFYKLLLATSSWADDTMRKRLVMVLPRAALSLYGERKSCLAEVRHALQYVLPRQEEIDIALGHRRYEDALALLTPDCDQPRHWLQRAAALTALGDVERADAARRAASQRIEEIVEQCGISTNDIQHLMCPSDHISEAELLARLP